MNLINPDESLIPLLRALANNGLHYYASALPGPYDRSTTLVDLALNSFGYDELFSGDFTLESIEDHKATILGGVRSITNTSGSDFIVYGYYVTNVVDTLLFACAALPSPITVPNGGTFKYLPILGDSSAFSSSP